jgi:hypothetical protein
VKAVMLVLVAMVVLGFVLPLVLGRIVKIARTWKPLAGKVATESHSNTVTTTMISGSTFDGGVRRDTGPFLPGSEVKGKRYSGELLVVKAHDEPVRSGA